MKYGGKSTQAFLNTTEPVAALIESVEMFVSIHDGVLRIERLQGNIDYLKEKLKAIEEAGNHVLSN